MLTADGFLSGMLVRVHTAVPGLVTQNNRQRLLAATTKAGGSWTAPMTAAIHYRLGDLEQAQPLLTTSDGKPQFQALAAMLLYDQGKVAEARNVLNDATTWFEGERDKDPDSAIPVHGRSFGERVLRRPSSVVRGQWDPTRDH